MIDVESISLQSLCYSSDIIICNEEIMNEFDLEKIVHKHFDLLVISTVEEYWYLLVEALEKVEG